MIGNGVTDDKFDSNHGVEFAQGHALVSPAQLQRLEAACGGNYWNATKGGKCDGLLRDMEDGWEDLNIYAIYAPCTLNGGRPQGSGGPLAGLSRNACAVSGGCGQLGRRWRWDDVLWTWRIVHQYAEDLHLAPG